MAKVQISINDELLGKVDSYCKDMFITRSGFISLLCSQYLQKNEVTKVLNNLQDSLIKICDGKVLSPEEEQELEDILHLITLVNNTTIK